MNVRGFGTRHSLISAGTIVTAVKIAVIVGVIAGSTTVDADSPSTPPAMVTSKHDTKHNCGQVS
jgi:hypothetical protein